MFRPLDPAAAVVRFTVDGKAAAAPAGCSVAGALLLAGYGTFRRAAVDGAPRGPYCMTGACHECLADIDGMPDCRTCMVPVRDGMHVRLGSRNDGLA